MRLHTRICTNFNKYPGGVIFYRGNLIGALSQHLIDIVILIIITKAIDNYPDKKNYETNCKKYIHFELFKGEIEIQERKFTHAFMPG